MDYKKLLYSVIAAVCLLCCQQVQAGHVGYYGASLSPVSLAYTAASSAAVGLGMAAGAVIGYAIGAAVVAGAKLVVKGAWWMVRNTVKGTYLLGKKAARAAKDKYNAHKAKDKAADNKVEVVVDPATPDAQTSAPASTTAPAA